MRNVSCDKECRRKEKPLYVSAVNNTCSLWGNRRPHISIFHQAPQITYLALSNRNVTSLVAPERALLTVLKYKGFSFLLHSLSQLTFLICCLMLFELEYVCSTFVD